jgi:hypothetical protein
MQSDEIGAAALEASMANAFVRVRVSDVADTFDEADDDEKLHHCPQCGEPCGVTDYSDGRCKTCVRADEEDDDSYDETYESDEDDDDDDDDESVS